MKKTGGLVLAVILLISGAAPTTHAAELQPLVQSGEGSVSVTWNVADNPGRPVVEGYIRNASGYSVGSLRVLVDRLDEAGRILDQRLAWVPGTLGGDDRLYFKVRVELAPRYNVRVFSYDRITTGGL